MINFDWSITCGGVAFWDKHEEKHPDWGGANQGQEKEKFRHKICRLNILQCHWAGVKLPLDEFLDAPFGYEFHVLVIQSIAESFPGFSRGNDAGILGSHLVQDQLKIVESCD